MNRLKKILLYFFFTIIIFGIAVILLISPVTKFLVTKYSERYTGRKITMARAYVNPFTGFIYFSNLKIREQKSDSIFFSAEGISLNLAILKLISGTYQVSNLSLDHPRFTVIQKEKKFNFNDLIEKFASKSENDSAAAPVHLNILNVRIKEGEFHYREESIPINYSLRKVNIISPGKRWDRDSVNVGFSFLPGTGSGEMKGDFSFNLKNSDYRVALVAHQYDLNIIAQYLKDLTSYGTFTANTDADIKAKGNLNNQEDLSASGRIAVNNFHFGKSPKEDYVAFDKMTIGIKELSPKNLKYLFDSISLVHPYFKYEIYDYLDNLQTIFGKKGANIDAAKVENGKFNLIIEIARYVKVLANSFFRSDYKISHLRIYKGDIKFNDFSLSEKFASELTPLNIVADSIDKSRKRVQVSLKSAIKPFGSIDIALSINPGDSSDFDMQYHFQKLAVTMFNPYIISVTSFPLDRGTIDFNGVWNVRKGNIHSKNHLVILDPRTTKRVRNKDTKWVPVPLIMTFIRDRGNVIDYQIPITGNLKDPKFHLKDVITDLLQNIFLKPPLTPYRLIVKNAEAEIEKAVTLKWATRQSSLLPSQDKFIGKIADFLAKKPDAEIIVHPQQYALKEKEHILFFEAKKKFFLAKNHKIRSAFSLDDSSRVENMSVKDPLFVHFLKKLVNDSLVFTIQEECTRYIDSSYVNARYNSLNKAREAYFISFFKKRGVDNKIKIAADEHVIPYNGFSFYKIEYKGEYPDALLKAYREMNELNYESPRKKYREERKNSKGKISVITAAGK